MKTKENPMLVSFEDLPEDERWNACVWALSTEYTLSLKDMCMMLKCSRSWATRYLKPHLHYIYVANRFSGKVDFLSIAKAKLTAEQAEKMSETTTWYSSEEFRKVILEHFSNFTVQTIAIQIERLIDPDWLDFFVENYKDEFEIKKARKFNPEVTIAELIAENEEIMAKCATPDGLEIYKNRARKTERGKCPPVQIELKPEDIDVTNLQAVHDMKEYGDTDEIVYRKLFEKGRVRGVLALPDANGEVSEKIFYIENPEHVEIPAYSKEVVLVKYSDYLKFMKA